MVDTYILPHPGNSTQVNFVSKGLLPRIFILKNKRCSAARMKIENAQDACYAIPDFVVAHTVVEDHVSARFCIS
jgi:hypothetical protein